MAYGIPVGELSCTSFYDASTVLDFLLVLKKFKFFRNVTVDKIHILKIGSVHRITIWENLNVNN